MCTRSIWFRWHAEPGSLRETHLRQWEIRLGTVRTPAQSLATAPVTLMCKNQGLHHCPQGPDVICVPFTSLISLTSSLPSLTPFPPHWSPSWGFFLRGGDEVEKKSFIALPGKGGHSGLKPSKLCVPTWGRGSLWGVLQSRGGVAEKDQGVCRAHIPSIDSFNPEIFWCQVVLWSVVLEVIEPSLWNIFHLVGISVSAKQLKDIVMCTPWGGIRTLPQGCTVVSWLFYPCLCIPSLPWSATVWTCPLELREGS